MYCCLVAKSCSTLCSAHIFFIDRAPPDKYCFQYFIYLFMALLGLCSSAWVSHCSGFSCYGAQALGAQASVIAAHRLSCSMACGILDQGSDLCLLHWPADS